MAFPSYQITIIDVDTGLTKLFLDPSTPFDIMYSRSLNDIGRISIELPQRTDIDYSALFQLDDLIEIYRQSPTGKMLEKEETYLLRVKHHFYEDGNERWIIGGLSLNHLLKRRVIDPEDDSASAAGYSTKSGTAGDVIAAYITDQCISPATNTDRTIPNFSINNSGVGRATGDRLRYDNLLDAIQRIAKRGEVDFIVNRTTANNFECVIAVIGEDKRVANYPGGNYLIFNPNFGNLDNPSFLEDRSQEKTYVYTLGQGDGVDRLLLRIPSDRVDTSPLNRIEFTEDARRVEYGDSTALLTQGEAALEENRGDVQFTFDLPVGRNRAAYKLNWDMGDYITAKWQDQQQDMRIIGVEISLSKQRGEEIKVTTETYYE